MTELNASSRLKVKRDTFFLPDQKGGVYFRNNVSSFRMEGRTIYQWIEILLPKFNGENTMGALTEGLTPSYRDRVYEIGETMYKNGFVRDLSKDIPHQLNQPVLEKYASQIEFIENFIESGAYHFQEYRKSNVLAVGSGPILISLVSALIESGLPKLNVMVTDTVPTNRLRLHELVENERTLDSEVEMVEVAYQKRAEKEFWKKAVQPFDWILYVSPDGDINEIRNLNQVCKEERKAFFPAVYFEKMGLAGPLTHPESEGCFESAWLRIHQSYLQMDSPQGYSSTAGAILANVSVFEFFKKAAGIADANQGNQIYLLNLETLEGDWLSFITHPFVASRSVTPELVLNLDELLQQKSPMEVQPGLLLEYFSQLTSKEIGIFHTWEERNLSQLPLSQCYVQAVAPVSEGPAELLPEVVCSGLTHEEARKNAGFKGIEMYVSKLIDSLQNQTRNSGENFQAGFIGIGSGETTEEAICRGLQAFLDEELKNRLASNHPNTVYRVAIEAIEDKKCRFYLNALSTLNGSPVIGLNEDISGFPVVWVRSNGRWYAAAGLNRTLALQNTLQKALLEAQNQNTSLVRQASDSMIYLERKEPKLEISSCDEMTQLQLLHSSLLTLKRNQRQLFVYDLSIESFLKEGPLEVYGVQVREGAFE